MLCNAYFGHQAQKINMRTLSIFKNGNNRAIRLPRNLNFEGDSELEIASDEGRFKL